MKLKDYFDVLCAVYHYMASTEDEVRISYLFVLKHVSKQLN